MASVRNDLITSSLLTQTYGLSVLVGGGQGVMIDPECGSRLAGADPRRDGYALAW